MELEDDTPQVEDRSMLEALEVLGIESQETTPSSEDVSMPSAIPGTRQSPFSNNYLRNSIFTRKIKIGF